MKSFISEFSVRMKGLGVIWKDVVALSVETERKFGINLFQFITG